MSDQNQFTSDTMSKHFFQLISSSVTVLYNVSPGFTVLVQIFEGRKFRGCHKLSIFAILFSRITGLVEDTDYVRTIIKYKFSRT